MRERLVRPAMLSAMLLAVLTTLPACSTTPSVQGGECRVFGPIIADGADTRSTLNQVAVHNSKGVRVCGWATPK